MFNNWKLLCSKRINEVDPKMAYPLMRWMSGKEDNLEACVKINELFFKVPPKMVISLLHVNCKGGFFKYPKGDKGIENDAEMLVREKLIEIYGWSNAEYDKNKKTISVLRGWGNFINEATGLDKKEAKLLGVSYETKKQRYEEPKPKVAGLDLFM